MCLPDVLILSPQTDWQVLLHGFAGPQHRCQILLGHSTRAFLFVFSCSRPLCGLTPTWQISRRFLQVGFLGSDGGRNGGRYWSLYVCTVLWQHTTYCLQYNRLSLWLILFCRRKKLPTHRHSGDQLIEWVHSPQVHSPRTSGKLGFSVCLFYSHNINIYILHILWCFC